MSYSNRNISVDDDVWLAAKELIKSEMNMTMSKFIEIQLRSLVRSKTGSLKDVVEGAMLDFIKSDKDLTTEEKTRMENFINEKDKDIPVKTKKAVKKKKIKKKK